MFDDTTDLFANPSRQPRPFVRFESRTQEIRGADGRKSFQDVIWVKVTPSGSKDCLEKPAADWIAGLEAQANAERIPSNWPRDYAEALEIWKRGEELPVHGTPIKTWSALTGAQRAAVLEARILTVEDLALANDEACQRIGMGARTLVDMAIAWVEESKGAGALAGRLENALAENNALKERVSSLEEKVVQLLAAIPKEKPAEELGMAPPLPQKRPGGPIVIGE